MNFQTVPIDQLREHTRVSSTRQPVRSGLDEYSDFLETKILRAPAAGREVGADSVSSVLYPFQRDVTRWAVRRGRAAIFADCGLGKTLMQLEWARHIGGTILIVAPLCVGKQTISEARKLDLEVRPVRSADALTTGLNITNYEMLKNFIGAPLDGIVLDESSILKSIDGKTRGLLLSSFADIPARLCCTATPCPNDIAELANHCEFLGVMKRTEMLASFFVHDEEGWRLRGHATKPFYRWLASWAMSLRAPADLGYQNNGFALPEIHFQDHIIETDWNVPGQLFPMGLSGIVERSEVRKRSADDRMAEAAGLALAARGQVIVWCGLNKESEGIAALLGENAVEISGADSESSKQEKVEAFLSGARRILISKPKIMGFGMNFQNAATMIFLGMGDSYESYYQCIRRSWRYGQKHPVRVHIVVTDHETTILTNVRRKEREAISMAQEMIEAVKEYEKQELQGDSGRESHDITETEEGDWRIIRGDCVEGMDRIAPESIGLSIFSPPFSSLYTYSASDRDLGNSKDHEAFFAHFGFVIDQLMRVTKPGRLVCCHVAQLATTLQTHGMIGIYDFRGDTIRAFTGKGWVYQGEVCIDKDPQAQAIRTHSKSLLFVQLRKDASWMRPGLADYILVFRKPGENAEPIKTDITNNQWIEWARPIWYGIRESDTLNRADARSPDDGRHICPLQLGTIERCVRLWSNPGDTILSPFAGIGSEGYVALQHGRRFIGCELKDLYAKVAMRNLRAAQDEMKKARLL